MSHPSRAHVRRGELSVPLEQLTLQGGGQDLALVSAKELLEVMRQVLAEQS